MSARRPAGGQQVSAGPTAGRLYAGSDLHNAADRSELGSVPAGTLAGLRNAAGVFVDVLRYRRGDAGGEQRELAIASGTTADNCHLTAACAGSGANRDWCLSTVFTRIDALETRSFTSQGDLHAALRDALGSVHIAFGDGIVPVDRDTAATMTFAMPAWVRQRVSIERNWQTQVDRLRRNTRQEVGRVLRKYGYECQPTNDPGDYQRFFEHVYRPYILRRHGPSALLVDRGRFLRECRRGAILQLLCNGRPIAGAVLRRVANTMAVLWTGTDDTTAGDGTRGVTDALDYFSLLYAHLSGCRWLDFGRSRPDLRDGALRYKRKWGAELTAGFAPQSTIRVGFGAAHADEFAYLRQHVFLSRSARRFTANVFLDGTTDPASMTSSWRDIATPGIHRYRFFVRSPSGTNLLEAIRSLDPQATVSEVASARAALDSAAT